LSSMRMHGSPNCWFPMIGTHLLASTQQVPAIVANAVHFSSSLGQSWAPGSHWFCTPPSGGVMNPPSVVSVVAPVVVVPLVPVVPDVVVALVLPDVGPAVVASELVPDVVADVPEPEPLVDEPLDSLEPLSPESDPVDVAAGSSSAAHAETASRPARLKDNARGRRRAR